jgi:lysophospholipase L1-like esterase
MSQRESKGVGQDGPTGSRSTARRILRIAASCVALAALSPFAANEQLRFQYMQTVSDDVAKVVPPRLVFLGDSNTAAGGNWGWRVLGNPISAINLGVSNYTIRQVAFMVPRAAEYRPSVVAVMAGTNDILANHASVEQIRRDFDFLMDALARAHEKSIVTLIPLSSDARFTPEIEAANAVIREVAARRGAAVIDLNLFIAEGGRLEPEMTVDGVHLSANGLNIWADQIGRTLAAMNTP